MDLMKKLDEILFPINKIEKLQLDNGENINDLAPKYTNVMKNKLFEEFGKVDDPIVQMPRNLFSKNQDMIITKHNRFSKMPLHKHNFIEMNYVYSGQCKQYVNGESVILSTNSLIMLDKNIPHSIGSMGKNDILINILLKDGNSINSILDKVSSSPSIVTKFMFNASQINGIHDNYIIFNLNHDEYAKYLMECLIYQGLTKTKDKNNAMHSLYSLLIPEFSKCIQDESINFNTLKHKDTLRLLNYIDNNFKTITLKDLANEFKYNQNYLGNKLKLETGQTFQELIDTKKFSVAEQLLTETNYSIAEIAYAVGYSSIPSLFRLFERFEHMTPNEYRKKKKDAK